MKELKIDFGYYPTVFYAKLQDHHIYTFYRSKRLRDFIDGMCDIGPISINGKIYKSRWLAALAAKKMFDNYVKQEEKKHGLQRLDG